MPVTMFHSSMSILPSATTMVYMMGWSPMVMPPMDVSITNLPPVLNTTFLSIIHFISSLSGGCSLLIPRQLEVAPCQSLTLLTWLGGSCCLGLSSCSFLSYFSSGLCCTLGRIFRGVLCCVFCCVLVYALSLDGTFACLFLSFLVVFFTFSIDTVPFDFFLLVSAVAALDWNFSRLILQSEKKTQNLRSELIIQLNSNVNWDFKIAFAYPVNLLKSPKSLNLMQERQIGCVKYVLSY